MIVLAHFLLGCDGGSTWQRPLKVYKRRGKEGSKAQALIWHSVGDDGIFLSLGMLGLFGPSCSRVVLASLYIEAFVVFYFHI
ncbi:hypothetical protein RchiOBHm_Chr7g0243231 [Rosa chinensis]|uniref:Uncharacterized protein n=1 Tax=Rosa chinensis TaxID=74649 RepID=A0A2P6PIQ0_ROSCH|nr:hypothetical protein RchiOBHm_Chr7g0243231 [Rosa chinensis]